MCSSLFSVAPRYCSLPSTIYAGVTRSKLAGYGALLLFIAGAAGYFQYQMRRIIISASRRFSTISETISSRISSGCRSRSSMPTMLLAT